MEIKIGDVIDIDYNIFINNNDDILTKSKMFEKTKLTHANIHGDNVVDIQYVGSTAIKGIMAKPMLDIAIVFKSITDSFFIIMKDNGYEYFGEVVTGKHLFILRGGPMSILAIRKCFLSRLSFLFIESIV